MSRTGPTLRRSDRSPDGLFDHALGFRCRWRAHRFRVEAGEESLGLLVPMGLAGLAGRVMAHDVRGISPAAFP